jgi:hypothetical protein
MSIVMTPTTVILATLLCVPLCLPLDQPSVVQQDNGTIVFLPGDAEVGKQDLQWDYKPTRWGKYLVRIETKGESTTDVKFHVEIGDKSMEVHGMNAAQDSLSASDSAIIYLPTEEKFNVTVKWPGSDSAQAPSLVALRMIPTCEGTPPVQKADGTVVLQARDATVLGTIMRYEPKPEKNTLGYWIRQSDAAEWQFQVDQPGRFDVEVLQGCGSGQGGSLAEVRVGEKSLSFTVEDTGHFQNFRPRIIGVLEIEKAGLHTLKIQPKKIAAKAAMDVRQIRLIPKND